MKTLTIKMPWAHLITVGLKDIENRTWKTSYRGPLLIHVGGNNISSNVYMKSEGGLFTPEQFEAILSYAVDSDKWFGWESMLTCEECRYAIIGKVDLVDVVTNHPSIWAEHSTTDKPIYNWVLGNPVEFEPVWGVKGKLSLWDYPIEKRNVVV